jgi:hypothetical protein
METYFTFRRVYLVASILLSLCIPLIQLNLATESLLIRRIPVERIHTFKTYYEMLVYSIDAEYRISKSEFEDRSSTISPKKSALSMRNFNASGPGFSTIHKVLLWIYLSGVVFLLSRFFFQIIWLYRYSQKNKKELFRSIKLVHLNDEIPSFSFLNHVFINKELLSADEFEQVFAHEKVHVQQAHTLDLLLARFMTIFQWLNPLVWRIHKSMKIVHEYIADRRVVEQGYELFDYQSLLLSQLISIRSVELVNNFNLLSIKKRIAMMNKIKSGRIAKLKVFIAVPIVIALFFIFSDMTYTANANLLNDANPDNTFINNVSESTSRLAVRSFKEVDPSSMTFNIAFDGREIRIGDRTCAPENFAEFMKKQIAAELPEERKWYSASLDIAGNALMKDITFILQGLRSNEVYKIAYLVEPLSGIPQENHTFALMQKLPPIDAEPVDPEKLVREGISLFRFEASDSEIRMVQMQAELLNFLRINEKYVMLFAYRESTSFSSYIAYTDLVHSTINDLRNELSQNLFGQDFRDLSESNQVSAQKRYPIMLNWIME